MIKRSTKLFLSATFLVTFGSLFNMASAASRSPLSDLEQSRLVRQAESLGHVASGRISQVGWNKKTSSYTFIKGKDIAGKQLKTDAQVDLFAKQISSIWGVSGADYSLKPSRVFVDNIVSSHVYKQFYNGLEVFDRTIHINTDSSDRVTSVSGNLLSNMDSLEFEPALGEHEVISYIEEFLKSTAVAVWNVELGISTLGSSPTVAYRMNIKMDSGKTYHVDVSASSGDVLNATDDMVDAKNKAVTVPAIDDYGTEYTVNAVEHSGFFFPHGSLYEGSFFETTSQSLVKDAEKGPYNLVDITRDFGFVYMIDGEDGTSLDLVQNDVADFTDSKFSPAVMPYQWMGYVLDFYNQIYGRNSYDSLSSGIVAVTNYKLSDGTPYNNASWSRSGQYIVFGSGDGVTYRPFGDDPLVAGHEVTHGFTQFTSALEYADQPGAINEANSDVMGWMIAKDREYLETGDPSVLSEWEIGKGLYLDGRSAIRDMKTPQRYYQVDHMSYYLCGGDVHFNSGIPNLAFVRLVEGDSQKSISPLETDRYSSAMAATSLFYTANTTYLTATSDFLDLWQALLASVPADKPAYADIINSVFNSLGVCTDGTNECNASAGSVIDSHITNYATTEFQYLGSTTSNTGDFNGDGFMDIISRHYDVDATTTSTAYYADFFFGKSGGGFDDKSVSLGSTGGNRAEAFALVDLNKDGFADAVVASANTTGVGAVKIYPGNVTGTFSTSYTISSPVSADYFGMALAPAGDFNGDGYQDLVVGANKDSGGVGKVYVVFGGANFSAYAPLELPVPAGAVSLGGWVNGLGDVNGDGFSDLAATAKIDAKTGEGTGTVLYLGAGITAGSTALILESGDRVMPVGDVNKDSFSDFAVLNTAVPYQSNPAAGRALVYYGRSGLTAGSSYTPSATFLGTKTDEIMGRFATGLDLNADGYSDFVVSSYETPLLRQGIVSVYYGSRNGLSSTPNKQWFGSYGSSIFGSSLTPRMDFGASSPSLVVGSSGYLPWIKEDFCRISLAGAFYQYTKSDL